MSLLYSRIFRYFITVNTLHVFLLFSFITVESAFNMASIQVSFNSISFCSMADGISFDVSLSLNCTDFYKREGGA